MQAASGRRVWHEHSSQSRGRRQFGYVVGAIVNVVLYYVVSSPLMWSIPFLTDGFVAVRAVIQLSLVASTIAYLAFVAYDAAWFRHSAQLILSGIAFAATYSWLTVFPFAFDSVVLADWVRIGLVFALVCIAIAAVVELCRLVVAVIRG